MGRAIKCTCSHCGREVFFDATSISFDALSKVTCRECGEGDTVITLNAEMPDGAETLDLSSWSGRAQ